MSYSFAASTNRAQKLGLLKLSLLFYLNSMLDYIDEGREVKY
jgi:hypothetical protein